jgi:hypothetical protein
MESTIFGCERKAGMKQMNQSLREVEFSAGSY